MSKVLHKFGIDIYKDDIFQGTNYIETEVDAEEERIMIEARSKGDKLPAETVLADLYYDVKEKAAGQERERCLQGEYPYNEGDFKKYRLQIFV